nr:immunoglobulin light chain junction region [Macaca mulatta]MOV80881.1 immunoglobulin light chain junction region [Macaca mulatta]MOV86404.1 immunoglobulin light chain junction region [Macaca mulatta]MOW44733.1 immunoglobulin light chain junction region [Macaca mulatta]
CQQYNDLLPLTF